jgi:tripartite-type tricarboxylate transporter receptor subunit TctC
LSFSKHPGITAIQLETDMQRAPGSRRDFLRHSTAFTAAAGLAGLGIQPNVLAQPLPGALRILCSGPAGSIPDIVARRYAEQISARYAGGAVVDNRTGAAGQIAVSALKQAAPDGATMLLAQGAIATVYPYLYPKLAYDPAVDLKAVSMAAEASMGLAVGPAVPDSVGTLRAFVEWARQNPKLANYGSPGIGTLPHLLGAVFFREARVDAQHVAYQGGPPAMLDLLGGRLAALLLPEGLLRQHQAAGKLRVLATSGAERSAYMPDVASFVEQGFPAVVMREWFSFFMPGATAAPLVDSASQAIRAAAAQAPVIAALAETGMVAAASTPSALGERIAVEQRYWQGVLRTTGIRAE